MKEIKEKSKRMHWAATETLFQQIIPVFQNHKQTYYISYKINVITILCFIHFVHFLVSVLSDYVSCTLKLYPVFINLKSSSL